MSGPRLPGLGAPLVDTLADAYTKDLASRGKLIEGGWEAMRLIMFPLASAAELKTLRLAYLAGAQHLFASIMNVLDPGTEPTDADMDRLNMIDAELQAVVAELSNSGLTPKGRA